jgi:phosphoribosylamine--glycine ligase
MTQVEEKVLVPTIHQMKRSRRPFRGVLYAGLMITGQGLKVLEFNARFGDPECQPLLMRLRSDLVELLEATVDGRLDGVGTLEWDPRPAVCVVMASEGYPGKYERGQPIRGLEEAAKLPDVKVFHAGTAVRDGQIVTNGGRVLGVTALGTSISAAKLQAYTAVKCIRFSGAWCRKDISDKALDYRE